VGVVGAAEVTVDVIVLSNVVVIAASAVVTAIVLVSVETLDAVFASCRACRALFATAFCPVWPSASSGPASNNAARIGSIMLPSMHKIPNTPV
jgi:hypothetical protein